MTRKRPAPWSPGIRKVLAHMREYVGYWQIIDGRKIRRQLESGNWACPITSAFDLRAGDWEFCGESLRLRMQTIERVVLAADGDLGFVRSLRAAMLRAAGLKEQR